MATENKRKIIKQELLDQLDHNGTYGKHYIDLIDDYMGLWDTKNKLLADIKERGVIAPYTNANGTVTQKKNESVELLIRVNAQMLKLLDALGVTPSATGGDEDEL